MNVFNGIKKPRTLGETYQIKVKVADGWQDQTVARLHISVGQDYHEGEKFQATVAWARGNFDDVIICVNDTLQRHNFIFQGKTPEEAHRISKAAGEDWIERNTTPEMRTDPHVKIVRWDDWIHLDNYDDTLNRVSNRISTDMVYGKAIETEAVNFWERMKKRSGFKSDDQKDDFVEHSKNYLLEECAVFSMMFRRAKAADIYPGSTLIPCQLFKPNKIATRGFTRIDFKKVTSAQSVSDSKIDSDNDESSGIKRLLLSPRAIPV